nr:pilus assembly protein TadG-related protein [Methylobacterium sp. PvR107]
MITIGRNSPSPSPEYAAELYRRSQMQNAADAAVLAGGNTLKLSPSNSTAVASIVQRIIGGQAVDRRPRRTHSRATSKYLM